jgi:dihydrofolate reductase
MGRRTWEYDLAKTPLVGRCNIILSSMPEKYGSQNDELATTCLKNSSGLWFVASVEEALNQCKDQEKVFIAGGESLYFETLELADTWELTIVEGDFEADKFFPPYQHLVGTKFQLITKEVHPGYRFETYKRL